jgi:hypothetical protein
VTAAVPGYSRERKSDVSAATPSTFFFAETDETRGVLGATVVVNPSKEHHSRSVFHTHTVQISLVALHKRARETRRI